MPAIDRSDKFVDRGKDAEKYMEVLGEPVEDNPELEKMLKSIKAEQAITQAIEKRQAEA